MGSKLKELHCMASRPATDAEVEERVKWFFEWCVTNDVRPGVEILALSFGTTRQTLWNWQREGGRKGDIITQTKQVIAALALTDREFKLMQDTATSYMELRLLNQLAESRTRTAEQRTYNTADPIGGRNGVDLVEEPNPYIFLKLPDVDAIYNAYNAYKTAARGLLYSYAGAGAELSGLLDDNTPNYIAVTMDSYFRNKHEERVKEIAASSPEIAEQFALDERYKEYFEA